MIHKQSLLLGAHISISGGFEKAIERGESIGCNVIQIFTKNNRQWHAKSIEKKEIELFQTAWHHSSIKQIIAHASYLINIGSSTKSIQQKSVSALIEELRRCEQLGITYLVIHPGSRLQFTEQECLATIIDNLNTVFEAVPGKTFILLETMAGQGSTVCYNFQHINYILRHSAHAARLGVCFDTCHVFASGYDLRDKEHYTQTWHLFDETIGFEKLKVIHINDSKQLLGSRIDRHEHIGKGKIGAEAFKLLFNDQKLTHIPKILETPKISLTDDIRNINFIKSIIKK